ncbi:MAG TPA: ion channel, partial [Candidatus Udaeobacter sp.]|nr:ion channel [Candidatus Udaeobacter sp.]
GYIGHSFGSREEMKKKLQRKPSHVSIRTGQVEFVKVGTDAWRWRDVYRWLLGLRWPQFALFVASLYIGLNLLFAALYSFRQDSIAGSTGGSRFFDCFFFSVQTLATVGYGHMYPQTLYGHIISTVEIMTGIFLLATMTGLIFVRFSRPIARVVFSNSIVIAPLNGKPTLMVRIGNENQHSMVEAEFRVMFSRDEALVEGGDFRYFYVLKLHFDRLTVFPAALTLRHTVDDESPLFGATIESLAANRALFIVSVVGIDPVLAAAVQTQKDYSWRDVQFGHRFVEIYSEHGGGRLTVDYNRLHDTESAE